MDRTPTGFPPKAVGLTFFKYLWMVRGRNVDKKLPIISIYVGPTKDIKKGYEKETNSCLKWASFNLDELKS